MLSDSKDIDTLEKEFNIILISSFKFEEYAIHLLLDTNCNEYELALSSMNRPFISKNSQLKIKRNRFVKSPKKTLIIFLDQIKLWNHEYGEIYVGSIIESKAKIYHKILSRQFNTTPIRKDDEMGNFFFTISGEKIRENKKLAK